MRFARINNGVVAEIGEFDSIEGRFHPSLVWVEAPSVIKVGWRYDSGAFFPPEDPQPTWEDLQREARFALDQSDITVLRCVESGVAVPAEWVSYRASLRAILSAGSGDPTQELPTRPAYPAGT